MLLAATALSGILFAAVVWPLLRRAQREAGEIVPLAVSPAAAAPEPPPLRRPASPAPLGGSQVSGYPGPRASLESCGAPPGGGGPEPMGGDTLDAYPRGERGPSYSVREAFRPKTGRGEIPVPLTAGAQPPA